MSEVVTSRAEVVTSRANARVKQLRAAFAGQARLSSGLVAIEGEHLLEEAVQSSQALKTIFLTERRDLPGFIPRGIEVIRVASDIFQSCVDTQTPQGIAALLVPRLSSLDEMLAPGPAQAPLILIAVGLQDPGNLGTLLRSAEAFGATGLLTTPGTVSPWNQKALRASAGSIFRMPIAAATPQAIERLQQAGVQLIATLKDNATEADSPAFAPVLRGPLALLIGNEGSGLSDDWIRLSDHRITIPYPGPVESLNAAVAGSILLWQITQLRRT